MKRLLLLIIILMSTFSLYAEELWSVSTGLNFTPGLVYNGSWEPAYNGSAAVVHVNYATDAYFIGAGIEAGYNYTGLSILFPVQAGLYIADSDILKFSASASIMPGLIMARPTPYFLIAIEAGGRLSWLISDDFALALSAGPRYTASPSYSSKVAALEMIDLTIGLVGIFRLQQ